MDGKLAMSCDVRKNIFLCMTSSCSAAVEPCIRKAAMEGILSIWDNIWFRLTFLAYKFGLVRDASIECERYRDVFF